MHRPTFSLALLLTATLIMTHGCTDAPGAVEPDVHQSPSDVSGPAAADEGQSSHDPTKEYREVIFLADASGAGAEPLVEGSWPDWSPDGRSIAFHREPEEPMPFAERTLQAAVHIIDVNEPGASSVTLAVGMEPSWSPDGTRIAFASTEGIAVMNADGTAQRTLVSHDLRDDILDLSGMGVGNPAWSPDGERIAFTRHGDGMILPSQTLVMNADGTNVGRLTPTEGLQYAELDPDWSLDGARIVMWSYGFGISLVDADGGVPVTLYLNRQAPTPWNPTVQPDGTLTVNVFVGQHVEGRPRCAGCEVWTPGGRVVLRNAFDAVWSPDGGRVAFVRVVEGQEAP